MRYYFNDFLSINYDDVKNAIGKPIKYVKNGVLYNDIIKGPLMTEVIDIPLKMGKKEPFIGIRVDETQHLAFNDSTIEYIEFPIIS